MQAQSAVEGSSLRQLGFWSALLSTLLIVAFDVAAAVPALSGPIAPWQGVEAFTATFDQAGMLLPVVPSLLLVPAFVVLMACVHAYAPAERKIWSSIGLAFALIYAVIIGLNYIVQITVVRWQLLHGDPGGLSLLVMGNPASVFWALEVFGYGFMSLAGLFAAPALARGPLERWAGRLWVASAILQAPGTAVYMLTGNAFHPLILASLGVWGVAYPVATALLAVRFRQKAAAPGRAAETSIPA